jgi:hypothetical protein
LGDFFFWSVFYFISGRHFWDTNGMTKKELGRILGDFFTDSSGHPACPEMAAEHANF